MSFQYVKKKEKRPKHSSIHKLQYIPTFLYLNYNVLRVFWKNLHCILIMNCVLATTLKYLGLENLLQQ